MKRLNLKIDGDLKDRFFKDADANKRGLQAEFEYLVQRALDDLDRGDCQQAREMREYMIEAGR